MKHIKIIAKKPFWNIDKRHDCRECQTPCKSACKTSVTIGNQVCEIKKPVKRWIW
ncbi:MAG: six-cysteine ranthipeptide SCIFF [Caldiserica bacterium]|jgi:predicted ribosomally synthesized six-cysteine peptide SCIFF|nr:six-cysteine ranthipeptide SCIFF [Caldisericota bacterium]